MQPSVTGLKRLRLAAGRFGRSEEVLDSGVERLLLPHSAFVDAAASLPASLLTTMMKAARDF